MAKKKVTIETLAKMISKGFSEMATKVETNKRFDEVDKRLDRIGHLIRLTITPD